MTKSQTELVEKTLLESGAEQLKTEPTVDSHNPQPLPKRPNAKYVVVETDNDFRFHMYDAKVSEPYMVMKYGVIPNNTAKEQHTRESIVFDCKVGEYEDEVRKVCVIGLKGRKNVVIGGRMLSESSNGTWVTEIPTSCENSIGRSYESFVVEGVYLPEHYGLITEDYMEMVDDWTRERDLAAKRVAKNAASAIRKCSKLEITAENGEKEEKNSN